MKEKKLKVFLRDKVRYRKRYKVTEFLIACAKYIYFFVFHFKPFFFESVAAYKEMDSYIEIFSEPGKKPPRRYFWKMRLKLLYAMGYYRIFPKEYFFYGFETLSDKGRKEYLGQFQFDRYLDRLCPAGGIDFFKNKYKVYQAYGPFFRREVIEIRGEEDREVFLAFAARHRKFIAKPLNLLQGREIRIVDLDAENMSDEEAFRNIAEGGVVILEELIVEAPELAKFHPSSVNTIRAVSFIKDDQVRLLWTYLRMGVGDNVVDNAGAGGISAIVDKESGIIITTGKRENAKERYIFHPDTGVQLVGSEIPRWKELLATVEALAKVMPSQQIVGWDLALTADGWVLVEGNSRPAAYGYQRVALRGLKKEIESIIL